MIAEQITKACTKCHKEKALEDYGPQKRGLYGRDSRCRSRSVVSMEYRNNPINKDRIRQNSKKWRKENWERARQKEEEWKIKDRYNITLAEYDKIFESQNGVCAICEHQQINNHRLCVDHCHKNLKVRGLLCHHCNRALGNFHDDIKILQKAIEYLKE